MWLLPAVVPAAPTWPAPGAPLVELDLAAPRNLQPTRIYLSAGHANGSTKRGNLGVHGEWEADVALWTTLELAHRLEKLDRFEVIVGRREGEQPSYDARIEAARARSADVFIELHTDARGVLEPFAVTPWGDWTYESTGDHGFSVLYNEGGPLGPERRRLASLVGESLAAIGLPAYPGYDPSEYTNDPTPGVFIDQRGLKMLRRPSMPSIIVETHNAKDFEESLRWREPATLDAFATAIAEAVRRFRTP